MDHKDDASGQILDFNRIEWNHILCYFRIPNVFGNKYGWNNVVIRSIQYNAQSQYLSMMVGSAITAQSDAEQEYQECLLKVSGLIEALELNQIAAV